MEVQAVTPWYQDKALYLAVLTPLCLLLSKKLGLALSAEELAALLMPVVAFIVGHKWKSGTIASAQVAASAPTEGPRTIATLPSGEGVVVKPGAPGV